MVHLLIFIHVYMYGDNNYYFFFSAEALGVFGKLISQIEDQRDLMVSYNNFST